MCVCVCGGGGGGGGGAVNANVWGGVGLAPNNSEVRGTSCYHILI